MSFCPLQMLASRTTFFVVPATRQHFLTHDGPLRRDPFVQDGIGFFNPRRADVGLLGLWGACGRVIPGPGNRFPVEVRESLLRAAEVHHGFYVERVLVALCALRENDDHLVVVNLLYVSCHLGGEIPADVAGQVEVNRMHRVVHPERDRLAGGRLEFQHGQRLVGWGGQVLALIPVVRDRVDRVAVYIQVEHARPESHACRLQCGIGLPDRIHDPVDHSRICRRPGGTPSSRSARRSPSRLCACPSSTGSGAAHASSAMGVGGGDDDVRYRAIQIRRYAFGSGRPARLSHTGRIDADERRARGATVHYDGARIQPIANRLARLRGRSNIHVSRSNPQRAGVGGQNSRDGSSDQKGEAARQ